MNNTSLDISGKIDGQTAGALAHVKAAADSMGISFFIIGALARDILLKLHYGLPPHRATLDVDLGVSVATWEHFSNLKNGLIENHRFEATNQVQRLQYERILVDIVPFGPIAGPERNIRWPPDESFQMSTAGFEEAFRFSHQAKVSSSPDVIISVCSLPGLVIMKLISWHERYPERRKDAGDIFEIMEKYELAGNFDRLYSEEAKLLEEEGFETKKAAIRLLGRDMAKIASQSSGLLLSEILVEETNEDSKLRLALDLARETHQIGQDPQEILAMVSKLRQGFEEEFMKAQGQPAIS
ncbi:MAG: nucleotidyl transferase AbiEii/AbiGii toxin family protein [Candidatus Aminicenantes bacterium]|nr:nucleotidyl transferase AbiEii/AbiGii toxin family protein [Candidatus Aminicenantes bacterium]